MTDFACFITATIICSLIGYLLGSISFAVIFTKHFANTDVREHGSKNAGMTNVMRTAGKVPGILTFICDFLKGSLSILIAKYLGVFLVDYLYSKTNNVAFGELSSAYNPLVIAGFVGFFCLLGHMFPIFFSFRGGKGVATIAGLALILDWRIMSISIFVFIVFVLLFKYVSLASIVAVGITPFLMYFLYNDSVQYTNSLFLLDQRVMMTIIIAAYALLVILKHYENIAWLIKGTERRVNIFSKNKGE